MDLRRHLSEIEIVMIEALEKADGMVSQASDALKLRRTTLIEKMKKYGISNKVNYFIAYMPDAFFFLREAKGEVLEF